MQLNNVGLNTFHQLDNLSYDIS